MISSTAVRGTDPFSSSQIIASDVMLELIDLDLSISKEEYERQFPALEQELGECQRQARAAGVPVIVVVGGWDASGKGTVINRICQALDPRGFKVHLVLPPDKNERLHPWMWRFWNKLPAAGEWAIFDRSWYRRVLEERIDGDIDELTAAKPLDDVREFEQQLALSGAVIVKFFLHISKREQKKRFKKLAASPATAWKVGRAGTAAAPALRRLDHGRRRDDRRDRHGRGPWTIVEATQRRYARLRVFRALVKRRKRSAGPRRSKRTGRAAAGQTGDSRRRHPLVSSPALRSRCRPSSPPARRSPPPPRSSTVSI